MIRQIYQAFIPIDIQLNQLLYLLHSSLHMYESLSKNEKYGYCLNELTSVIDSRTQIVEEIEKALPESGFKIDKRTSASTMPTYPPDKQTLSDLSAITLDEEIGTLSASLMDDTQVPKNIKKLLDQILTHIKSKGVERLHCTVVTT